MKYYIITLIIMTTFQAQAIKVFKNEGGSIKTYDDASKLDDCKKVIYRNAAKGELSAVHKKNLVSATLKGDTKNDLGSAGGQVKSTDGYCTYGENSESMN